MLSSMKGKRVLITGGAGFLGSSLAKRLVKEGANITLAVNPKTDLSRISEISNHVEIFKGDLTEKEFTSKLVKNKDFLFHFAWQTDLKRSNKDPLEDISKDISGLVNLLESIRENSPKIKVIFSSTVTVIGDNDKLPVDESFKENPISIYDVHKLTAEKYLYNYYRNYGIRFCALRLSNIFGEMQKIDNPNRGVLNFMVGRALRGEELTVYGDGEFIRDYCYVENYVDAFISAALFESTDGKTFVMGSGEGKTFNEVVQTIKRIGEQIIGKGVKITKIPFPEGEHEINKRDFIANTKSFSSHTGWSPKIDFEEGVKKTIEYHFKKINIEKKNYLITGALGHIGSELIRAYSKRDDVGIIRMMDNLSTQRFCSLFKLPGKAKLEFIEGDILDEGLLKRSMKDIDIVIHLAAITNAPETLKNPKLTKKINFDGTKKVLEIAIEEGVKKFFFPSTTSVYGEASGVVDEDTLMEDLNPSSPYAEYKLQCEKMVLEANGKNGIQTFVLRKGTIYGHSDGIRYHTAVNKFVWLACMNKKLTVWDSAMDSKRPYLGLKDSVRAYEFIEKQGKPGELYNILTRNYTIMEIVETIKKFKPEVDIEITKSPILNQKSYEVSDLKIRNLGFIPEESLEKSLEEEISFLGGIDNT